MKSELFLEVYVRTVHRFPAFVTFQKLNSLLKEKKELRERD